MEKSEVQNPEQVAERIPTVYMMQGLPGSGKSSWARNKMARNPKTLVVCRDDLRRMVRGGEYVFDPDLEPVIVEMDTAILRICLRYGFDVIMDETNISRNRRRDVLGSIEYSIKCEKELDAVRTVCVVMDGGGKNLDNRMADGRGYSRDHWAGVIEKLRGVSEPVGDDEGFDLIVRPSSPEEFLDA